MRKLGELIGLISVLSLILATGSFASQEDKGLKAQSRQSGNYDPKTVEIIRGEVVSVENSNPHSVCLMVKTDKGNIPVHLGPEWYVAGQVTKIAAKDKIKIKGSRITWGGKPAIIACEVTKGDKTLVFRDGNGFPVWSVGVK